MEASASKNSSMSAVRMLVSQCQAFLSHVSAVRIR